MSHKFESSTVGDSPQLQLSDDENAAAKVTNSNNSETKQIVKTELRAFNVKQTSYKLTLESFTSALRSLHANFKPLKNLHVEQSQSKNDVEFEDLETAVRNVIETQLLSGTRLPKSTGPPHPKKDHRPYVSDIIIRTPVFTCPGTTKSHAAIGAVYDCASKIVSEISDANAKYGFWLKEIVREGEFYDLDEVREYLAQNAFERSTEILDSFRDCLLSKFKEIVDEVDAEVEVENRATKRDGDRRDEELGEIESFELYEREMAMKIKRLSEENQKLQVVVFDNRQQVTDLLEELETRNRQLANAKDAVLWLTKERNDLISVINKMRVNDENYEWLQKNLARHQAKNKHLRSIIDGTNDDTYNISLE